MGFTDVIKTEVRKKAHMACCLCKTVGVEIHHIVPQEEGGPDTIQNAAPLCPTCHEIFGANPIKRKMILEARDNWYEICEKRFASDRDKIDLIHQDLEALPEKVAIIVYNKLAASGVITTNTSTTEESWSLSKLVAHFYALTIKDSCITDHDIFAAYQFLFVSVGDNNNSDDFEFNTVRNQFLKIFGEHMAKQLCLLLLKRKPIRFQEWFSEEDLNGLFSAAFPLMFCLLRHIELGENDLNIRSRFDGELEMLASSFPSKGKGPV